MDEVVRPRSLLVRPTCVGGTEGEGSPHSLLVKHKEYNTLEIKINILDTDDTPQRVVSCEGSVV